MLSMKKEGGLYDFKIEEMAAAEHLFLLITEEEEESLGC